MLVAALARRHNAYICVRKKVLHQLGRLNNTCFCTYYLLFTTELVLHVNTLRQAHARY